MYSASRGYLLLLCCGTSREGLSRSNLWRRGASCCCCCNMSWRGCSVCRQWYICSRYKLLIRQVIRRCRGYWRGSSRDRSCGLSRRRRGRCGPRWRRCSRYPMLDYSCRRRRYLVIELLLLRWRSSCTRSELRHRNKSGGRWDHVGWNLWISHVGIV